MANDDNEMYHQRSSEERQDFEKYVDDFLMGDSNSKSNSNISALDKSKSINIEIVPPDDNSFKKESGRFKSNDFRIELNLMRQNESDLSNIVSELSQEKSTSKNNSGLLKMPNSGNHLALMHSKSKSPKA